MKVLTEFVGTFFFLFTISLAANGGSPLAALAIGGALMVMVYMGGHLSGAHYNPAVSTALLIRKKMPAVDYVPYLLAQIAAGILAFLTGWWISGQTVAIAPGSGVDPAKALIVEIIFTAMLALVVLNVATHRANAGKGFYGLAIGFTIVIAAIAGGGISGGAFNPAVGIGATVIDATQGGGSFEHIWLYIVGPLAGGVLASLIYGLQEGDDADAEIG
jgi:aquaporin Z